MPTWNRGGVIQNAIRSIIDQTYENWELIIVDDGSTDATKLVIDTFSHPQIKYFPIEHQNNISRVRNIGNQLANGELIVVQDSDDLSFPDRLEEIVKCFDETGADIVYHGAYNTYRDPYTNAVARRVKPAQPFDRDRLKSEQYIPGQVAYTKKAITETPYDESITLMDDLVMLLEFAYTDKKFAAIFKNLYEYVGSADSINIRGEVDGRRRQDAIILVKLLKDKYGVDVNATMTKSILGEVITTDTV